MEEPIMVDEQFDDVVNDAVNDAVNEPIEEVIEDVIEEEVVIEDNFNETPMVFSWMPALAIYFDDPDGHCLEFISILEGQPKPELGIITFDEWERETKI